MDSTNYIKMAVGAIVVILVAVSVILPIFAAAGETTETLDNSDFARHQMKTLETGDTWTRTGSTWYYNDEEVTTDSSGGYSILFTDSAVIRENGGARGPDLTGAYNSTTSAEIVTVDETTLGLSVNESTSYINFEYGYGAVADGDYIMKTMEDSAYILGNETIYISGVTNVASATTSEVFCVISGSIADGFTVTVSPVKNATISDIVVGEITVNAEEVEGYVNLYLFTSIEFTLSGTYNEDTVSTNATYGTFVMQKEVTAETTTHPTGATLTIIQILPVLILVGVMLFIVNSFVANRRV